MRILLISQWYTPEPQKMLAELAQTLTAYGHQVTVLTGFPNWPQGKLYPGYRVRIWQKEFIDGVPVVRVPLYPDHSNSALRRVLSLLSFAISVTLLGPFLVPRPDVIQVLQPITLGFPAWLLGKLWRVPFVLHVLDLWPETLSATGLVRSPRLLRLVGRFASWVYEKCAAIRVVSPGVSRNLVAKGVAQNKIFIVPNWVDTEFYRPRQPESVQDPMLGPPGKFTVMFAGAIGPAQDIDTVLQAARLLADMPAVEFTIAGEGTDRQRLQAEASQLRLQNIRFLGWRPADEMPTLLDEADVLLLHLRDDPLFRITVPHKTYTYLAMGKPVLAALNGDAADVVLTAGGGISCRPGCPEDLARTIRRLVEMPGSERRLIGQRGREAACRLYSRRLLVRQVESILLSVTGIVDTSHDARSRSSAPASPLNDETAI